MEFKVQEKWRVQQKFNMSDKQMDMAIKRMIKRHPLEEWIDERIASNGQRVVYFKLEFVEWLRDVYSNGKKYYLDLDIDFFKRQILRLEKELGIPHKEIEYNPMTIRELSAFFDRSINTIYVALIRMRNNNFSQQYLDDGKVLVSKEGVKWLSENYFRTSYLENLELYKLDLQEKKRIMYEQSRRKI